MSAMDNSIPFEELERRRRKASSARKSSQPKVPPPTESEAMAVINEIFNPTLKLPKSTGQYKLPDEFSANDDVALSDLDIKKLAELKEVFVLFDIDGDGLLSKNDLRCTFLALGTDMSDEQLDDMLKEAKQPLNYEAFVEMICNRTLELDPEDVLLEAWSKWDDYGTGKIDEKKIYTELTNYGDVMSTSEADEALKHAPLAKPKSLEEPPMIDYPAFCQILSGLRKPKQPNEDA
ncbi:myosin regulatory light chain LC-2, mantle muscle [Teleopsis dalmanni]|uniref:myosin regulatory light chain LC-2, mantle muscle n=1 Tax=Teleopsis dalmanni TaxID=139649 RepID=UPI0018CEEDF0|nr:myosin regulatory light chain LC-2, mantle muscle [Teleopsis dalmanni]